MPSLKQGINITMASSAYVEAAVHALNAIVAIGVVFQCIYMFTFFADGGSLLTDPRLFDNGTTAMQIWFAVLFLAGFEMLYFRDTKGKTFWERYANTPASYLAIALVFAHMIGFGCYAALNVVLGRNTLNPADGTDQLPKNLQEAIDIVYWPHVIGMGVCMLSTFLQFVAQIRKWKRYTFHRWNGWLIVVAGTIGVLAGFAINVLELYIPVRYGAPNTSIHFWMESMQFFAGGAGALTSSTLGAYYAVKRDIPRHAAWMHRLPAWWMSASAARIYFIPLYPVLFGVFGAKAGPWIEAWISLLLPVIIMEFWIKYSGRFDELDYGKINQEKCRLKRVGPEETEETKLASKGPTSYDTFL
mmetsp:Transcript_19060/g.46799  ORF Transcript_19060/g.46799 Transcript_19060/m.46799 type:complete len:358 (-) Transcript_19060:106-1179(-)|eukprot:CAMPEP_0114494058 /NCGR_PEP_ID=MMETSP0109-20121206/4444_1 /TAXON_ID=29199 /ORGANISM="Chlorarachnion reptans, Strain CCCM449" /LENGTH=357 /DNA_ID=CAMNT_0001671059 /DNA_START=278 /DNA_END=1351 /DNA_ORIENTATION=+